MKFTVLKPFTWDGEKLVAGDTLEIDENDRHLYGLQKARFVVHVGNAPPRKIYGAPAPEEPVPLPTLEQVEREISQVVGVSGQRQEPRSVVEAAKARAAYKQQ